jgi:hypothetical protein
MHVVLHEKLLIVLTTQTTDDGGWHHGKVSLLGRDGLE